MAKYMLFLYGGYPDGLVPGSPEARAEDSRWYEHTQSLRADNVLLADDALQPPATAVTVSRQQGEQLVKEGPFMDPGDWLVGYYVLELPDLESAVSRAAAMPNVVNGGFVEIRPVQTFE
jgi:hypothetical protein